MQNVLNDIQVLKLLTVIKLLYTYIYIYICMYPILAPPVDGEGFVVPVGLRLVQVHVAVQPRQDGRTQVLQSPILQSSGRAGYPAEVRGAGRPRAGRTLRGPWDRPHARGTPCYGRVKGHRC